MKTFTFYVLAVFLTLAGAAEAAKINDVSVRGKSGREVVESTVLAFVSQKAGDEFSQRRLRQDIRQLEETERYSFVGVEMEQQRDGLHLIFVVQERPRMRSLRVRGGDHFSNAKIRRMIELNVNDRVDEAVLRTKLDVVREEYIGDYFPDVTFDITLSETDDRGYTDVEVDVNEGKKAKVTRIKFGDTSEYTGNQIRKAMQQKQRGIFSWITGRGRFEEQLLDSDLATIEDMYRRKGYLDVAVGRPEVKATDRGRTSIFIPIDKHKQYFVKGIEIKGATLFPVSLLGSQVRLKVGDPANATLIRQGARAIRDYYNNRGYANTVVLEDWVLTGKDQLVTVVYTVREGRILTVRNVQIRGNTRTKDHVIRRELSVFPGDHLNEVKARTSTRRLRNLGFFDNVNHTVLPTGDPDRVDIAFDVEEGRSGQFVAGAGFSSVENIIGFVELSQGNFDLTDPPTFTGGGEKLRLRLQLGDARQDAEITYARPWFLNQRMTLSTSLFQRERRFLSDDYDQQNTGFSLGLRRALGPRWRVGLTYTLEDIEVLNVSDSASALIRAEEGSNVRSGIDLSFTRDTRNDVWTPSKGGRVVLNSGFTGGALGFDTEIYELGIRSSFFYPMILDHVLNLRGRIRTVDFYGDTSRVPIFDRLFLGGPRDIRGFEFRDVGPRDDTEETIGGQSSTFAAIEYTIPLTDQFRYALFYDWGFVNLDAFDFGTDDFNASYGMGLRIDMPGFPLRFDYSWQQEADEVNESNSGRFSFLIGHSF